VKRLTNPQRINLARNLRRQQTDAELLLWNTLRNAQVGGSKFRRQHPIGNYIVDFVNLEKKLIVEIDGGQHNNIKTKEKDDKRTLWLNCEGYKVLRFWNNDILSNIDGVFLLIQEALK
jgi:very-short-patch-repair endonuclease